MRLDRLEKLADFLDNLHTKAPAAFDLHSIVGARNHADIVIVERLQAMLACDFQKHDCGATACAIGWMPAAFPNEVRWDKDAIIFPNVPRKHEHAGEQSFHVARQFFEIEIDTLFSKRFDNYLFEPPSYPQNRRTAADVAIRIRDFIHNSDIGPYYTWKDGLTVSDREDCDADD